MHKIGDVVERVPFVERHGGSCCLPVGVISFITAVMTPEELWDIQQQKSNTPYFIGEFSLNLLHPFMREGLVRTSAMGYDPERWCISSNWIKFEPDSDRCERYLDEMERLARRPYVLEDSRWHGIEFTPFRRKE